MPTRFPARQARDKLWFISKMKVLLPNICSKQYAHLTYFWSHLIEVPYYEFVLRNLCYVEEAPRYQPFDITEIEISLLRFVEGYENSI